MERRSGTGSFCISVITENVPARVYYCGDAQSCAGDCSGTEVSPFWGTYRVPLPPAVLSKRALSRAVVVEPAAWIFTGTQRRSPMWYTTASKIHVRYQHGVPMASMSLTTLYLIEVEARAWL
ncbi:hypothetical protein EXIGLDRAFT_735944 [Exidia glandulosa HHB12029]|uniref:Uncharacterized protein n=1 Tax=Exidia glandulosa HHB12029 TaxID=1314781 RepID=A0A166ND52_EXIGL|nr:hypothetical protein EXIGLDRAFT_735944 [Exidia glandulosa HHB12029]